MACWNPWHRLIREVLAGALKKFRRLSVQERRTYLKASGLLLLAECSLQLWSFQTILKTLRKRCAGSRLTSRDLSRPEELASLTRLVELADRHGLFRPSCLRQALVAAWLLSGRGIAPSLLIGVAKEDGQLRAHAWVEAASQTDTCLVGLP